MIYKNGYIVWITVWNINWSVYYYKPNESWRYERKTKIIRRFSFPEVKILAVAQLCVLGKPTAICSPRVMFSAIEIELKEKKNYFRGEFFCICGKRQICVFVFHFKTNRFLGLNKLLLLCKRRAYHVSLFLFFDFYFLIVIWQ